MDLTKSHLQSLQIIAFLWVSFITQEEAAKWKHCSYRKNKQTKNKLCCSSNEIQMDFYQSGEGGGVVPCVTLSVSQPALSPQTLTRREMWPKQPQLSQLPKNPKLSLGDTECRAWAQIAPLPKGLHFPFVQKSILTPAGAHSCLLNLSRSYWIIKSSLAQREKVNPQISHKAFPERGESYLILALLIFLNSY